jgi:hypothetical protein
MCYRKTYLSPNRPLDFFIGFQWAAGFDLTNGDYHFTASAKMITITSLTPTSRNRGVIIRAKLCLKPR